MTRRRDNATSRRRRFIDHWSRPGQFSALPPLKQRAFTALLPKVLMEFRAVSGERRINLVVRDFDVPVCLMHGNSSPFFGAACHRLPGGAAAAHPPHRVRRGSHGPGHAHRTW
jgi:hypothetical protein